MTKRKLLIALVSAGVATAGFGAAVFPASAKERTFVVTLIGGQSLTFTVDAPEGAPASSITFPGVSPGTIVSITEITPPDPAPTQPPAEGGEGGSGGDTAGGGQTTPAPSGQEEPSGSDEQRAGGDEDSTEDGRPSRGKKGTTVGKAKRLAEERVGSARGKKKKRATRRRSSRGGFRNEQGLPTLNNPTVSVATPGAAPIGVPNFFIEKFRIPAFLLPIYQAAGTEYGVRWEILAAINEIETDYGRNLNVSSAGALGWMQFMPATWKQYGVDANRDGRKDPYNPVDAIFAAARYLKAAGAEKDLRKAIFAYNHADWYVDSVLMRARLIGGLPANLVGSLTGLTQGHFPVYARARYADDISEREAEKRMARGRNAARPVEADGKRRGINIYAEPGAPVIAVQDGKIVKMGHSERLGRFIQMRDAYGNTYTYGHLKKVARHHPVPKERKVTRRQIAEEMKLPKADPKPTRAASAGSQGPAPRPEPRRTEPAATAARAELAKERLFAHPRRPAAFAAGGKEQLLESDESVPGFTTFRSYFTRHFGLDRDDVVLKPLEVGSKVIAGTILGRIGVTDPDVASHVLFEIRPAGRGAPRIDPKPILDGWKLLESTAIYRAKGRNALFGPDAKQPTIGQILLMSKTELERRVLANPRIEIYGCGRQDIEGSEIDRRVLASLEFLAASGLKPTVTSLKCGRAGIYTKSGSVSHHVSGNAVDIAKVNGVPVLGHQGKGSITDIAVRRLLTLQGTMKPAQIITLMKYENTDNTYAMSDHHDHIHIGWQPMYGTNSKLGRQLSSALKPGQWIKLIDRLGDIDNPTVRVKPSKYAITVDPPERASHAHRGE